MASSRLDPEGLWCIHGKRYDLRKNNFLEKHPGGREHLERCRGRDVTEMFESYHAIVGTPGKAMMDPMLAERQDSVPTSLFAWDKPALYDDVKQRARQYFRSKAPGVVRGDEHKMPRAAALLNAFFITSFFGAACGWYVGSCGAGAVAAMLYWLGPSGLMHSGSHSAISRNNTVNYAATLLGSFHTAPLHWYVQHVIGHHSHTNMHGYDPDLEHFRHNTPGYRLHQRQPQSPRHIHWRAGMALQSVATTVGPALLNQVRYLWSSTFECMPVLNHNGVPWHVLNRVLVVMLTVLYPFMAFDLYTAAALIIVPYGVHGFMFYLFSQVSHLQARLFYTSKRDCWATHQALSSCDYRVDSRLWNVLSLGLNTQIVHHLLPTVDPWHYPALSRIIHKTLKEHGVVPLVFETYAQAARGHVEYVSSLNNGDATIPGFCCHRK
uniref:Cytochrome b5 heme-binding domain-containing protein n=1 Tax=viral metagenome TaxID=1070528 RepID=A0A6C0KB85_9ZZZZ